MGFGFLPLDAIQLSPSYKILYQKSPLKGLELFSFSVKYEINMLFLVVLYENHKLIKSIVIDHALHCICVKYICMSRIPYCRNLILIKTSIINLCLSFAIAAFMLSTMVFTAVFLVILVS